jgi:ABC transport system ATP-binding/permease protein
MREKNSDTVSKPETKGSLVEALHLNKWVTRKINILQDVSLVFKPGEFIAVVGQSGGGKTTMVDAIAGFRPASNGKVFVDGIDVYRNSTSMRGKIGYVPQRDIIHMELTVYQALDYSAKLRLPKKTKRAERKQRIEEVLEELDLQNHKNMRISELSGGQQKRVSIGVELLTRPQLFFLDEPTSGLDPGNETMFMRLLRRLADQGRTVILITHATKNVMMADKVLFMGRGGHMAFFGPPHEAMEYFSEFREEDTVKNGPMEFDEIYAILDNPAYGNAKDWGVKFTFSKAYHKYIEAPLLARQKDLEEGDKKTRTKRIRAASKQAKKANRQARRQQISSFRQFFILSARNLNILFRDRSSLILMLLIAPIVGTLDLMLAPLLGKDVLSF